MNKPAKKFLKLPEYPGGKKALREYIKNNLQYPNEAFQKRIEGVVYCTAEINDNGIVNHVNVTKGLPGGCDEEAVRLIKSMKFGNVKNRGVRIKTKRRFRIRFELPPTQEIKYSLVKNNTKTDNKSNQQSYTYTI